MGDTPLDRRANHCFLSYASEDAPLARRLAEWLGRAGLRVWFDEARMRTGAPVVDELTRQLCDSRACLFVMTDAALAKSYVKHEVEIACEQQVTQPGFALLAVRTDARLDPTSRFPSLRKLAWTHLPGGELDLASARRLLLSLTPAVPKARGKRHVFVSCGWGHAEEPITRRVGERLLRLGVRAIGDARDQGSFGEEGRARVARIMSGCTGHLLVLPQRRPPGKSPEETYRYFLAEWELGRRLGLARRTLCVSREGLPEALRAEAKEIGTGEDPTAFEADLTELHDETEPVEPHVFLATDHQHARERNEAARDVVEHVLGMECGIGSDYPGEGLAEALVEKIVGANVVFADLACRGDDATKRLIPNLNTHVEAGIAIGGRRPLFVTSLDPRRLDEQADRTKQTPFMLRNRQIHWYGDPVDHLAVMHRLATALRRRVLDLEWAASP